MNQNSHPFAPRAQRGDCFRKRRNASTVRYEKDPINFLLIVMIAGALTGCSNERKQSFQATESIVYSFDGEQTLCNRADAQI
jgi:hypothetical protein